MFENKKNKKIEDEQELTTKVNQDLLVRNMPSLTRLNSVPVSAAPMEAGGNELLSGLAKPKNNFKAVGILIILGGLVLVGGLIYISYIFIIKPQTTTVTPVVEQTQKVNSIIDTINNGRATTSEEVTTIATSSIVATTTPAALDLDISSASSTSEELDNNQTTDLLPILDSDADGLNDDEELVLGTNPQSADSNNNGYADLTEVENGYDPAVVGKLDANANLAKYINKNFSYDILYPKAWSLKSLDEESTTIFTALDNSIIQISIQENSDKQSIAGWYGNAFPEETITYDKIKSTESWDGIWGSNYLNFYLIDKNRANIYVISFISPTENRVAYPNIFRLMINSLIIK